MDPRPRLMVARLCSVLALLACFVFTSGATAPQSLENRIDQVLAQDDISTAFWGVYVRDLQSNETIYAHNPLKKFMPASTMKLLTAATAVDLFGGDHRFQTTLYFDGEVDGSVLRGDLIIRGSGDPTFGTDEMDVYNPLQIWARRLGQMGVTRFEGRLIGDDNVMDDVPYAAGWDITYMTQQASRSLGLSIGGLSYNDNVVSLRLRSSTPGQPPNISTSPSGYLNVENKATTSSRQYGWNLDIQRNIGTETITLTGSLPRSYRGTIFVPVTNPTTYTMHSFKNQLEAAGIDIEGAEAYDMDELGEDLDYQDDAEPIYVYFSPPLQVILSHMNEESINYYADMIFGTFGYSDEAAENRVEDLLTEAGVNTSNLSIRDGSGLSRKDLISPYSLGMMLAYMANEHAQGDVFQSTLAEGGEPGTTLRYRLGGVPVRAKTGSLSSVRALAGYTVTANGRPVAFAMMANHYSTPSYRIVQTLDQIVRIIHSTAV